MKYKFYLFCLFLFGLLADVSAQTFYRYHTVIDQSKPNYSPTARTWKQGHLSIVHDTTKKQLDFYTNNQSGTAWTYQFSIPIGGSGVNYIPEFRKTSTAIEWKYTIDTEWTFLVSLDDLRGAKGDKGDKGDTGAQGQPATVTIGTVTTLPAGSQATVTNSGSQSNAVLNFGIPRGQDGVGGFQFVAYPENYGAVNANRTFAQAGLSQAYIDANYAGLGFTVNDQIDGAALSKAMRTGMPVFITKTLYINKLAPVRKSDYNLWIQGFNDTINVVGSPASLFNREQPASLAEAELMANSRFRIDGLIFNINNTTTIGVDLGASYQAHISNCRFFGGQAGIKYTFALESLTQNVDVTNAVNGIVYDYYRTSWGTANNTACNASMVQQYRYYGTDATYYGIRSYATDGLIIEGIIVEGTTCRNGVFIDQINMNTAKRFNISGIHSECVQGMADAFVRIELGGGTAEVSNITAHYATILVAAKSLGVLVVTVKNIGWAVPLNGKIFSNDNCGWVFANLSQSIVNPNDVINSIRNAFTGTVPSYVSPSVSGVTATSTAQPVTLNLTGGAQTVTFTPVVTTTINTSNAVITPKAIVGYNQFTYLY